MKEGPRSQKLSADTATAPEVVGAADLVVDSAAPSGEGTRRPTIFDVARVAGVSYSTVSRVVNGNPYVRDATRARVQAAMAELGYVAHVTARSLARGKTQAIGLLAMEIDNPFFSLVINSVDHAVSAIDFDLLLCTTHNRREREAEYVARLSHGMVDGLLIVLATQLPAYVGQLQAQRFPFVLIDHDSELPGGNVVNAANRDGARTAVSYLIDMGHRRIGFITGRPDVGSAHERLRGYREALEAAGIRDDPTLIVQGDFQEVRGHDAALELLRLPRPPTAIFASSDMAAFGVLRAARDLGLTVPRDLSVVGFDDIKEARFAGPGLTTVHQPLQEMGNAAVSRLLSLIEDRDQPPARIVLETDLVIRGTTAAPDPGNSGTNA